MVIAYRLMALALALVVASFSRLSTFTTDLSYYLLSVLVLLSSSPNLFFFFESIYLAIYPFIYQSMSIYICISIYTSLCVSFETPAKGPVPGYYAACVPAQLVYLPVPAPDGPATAVAADGGTPAPGSVPTDPNGSGG